MNVVNNSTKMIVIPAIGLNESLVNIENGGILRVAAYCRVSTSSLEQESSYESQVSYFKKLIDNNNNWSLVSIYADPGLSGKNTQRPEFQRMMQDARAGKIDKILAKSVSRFARNTLDCVACCRELKELGIGVFFEKENINTLEPTSSFILTLMASLAEEESRQISANTKWGIRKRFSDGDVKLNVKNLYGYYFDEKSNIYINEGEAELIRSIFYKFIGGVNVHSIAQELNLRHIPTKFRKRSWSQNSIKSILTNERYKGDMKLQKTFKYDFLSKQRKNKGQVEAYYIENHHTPIVSPAIFDLAQFLIKNEYQKDSHFPSNNHVTSSHYLKNRIYCGDCSSVYLRKKQDNKKEHIKTWVCSKHKKTKDCPCIPIKESVLLNAIQSGIDVIKANLEFHIYKCEAHAESINKQIFENNDNYSINYDKLNSKIEDLSITTTNYNDDYFKEKLLAIRKEFSETKNASRSILLSYHQLISNANKSIEMMNYIKETRLANNDSIEVMIDKLINKIIVIDNDLPSESINITFNNGETINVKLVNIKKTKKLTKSVLQRYKQLTNAICYGFRPITYGFLFL